MCRAEIQNRIRSKIKNLKLEIQKVIRKRDDIEPTSEEDIAFRKSLSEQIFLLDTQVHELENTMVESTSSKVIGREFTVDYHGRSREFVIVPSVLADPREGLISLESPMAKKLVNKKEGDKVTVESPIGKMEYRVVNSD